LSIRSLACRVAAAILAFLAVVQSPTTARAGDEPDFISFGAGYFDWKHRKNDAAEFRLEYRSDYKLWVFRPLGGVMFTSDKAVYAFAGVGLDVFFGNRFVVTPSFAPGYYREGDGLDLGYGLEFRSQIEFAYRFDDRSRLGLAISHMSNAGLGDTNPGTESAILYYSMPVDNLTNLFR
jgi:hypothetical protein